MIWTLLRDVFRRYREHDADAQSRFQKALLAVEGLVIGVAS